MTSHTPKIYLAGPDVFHPDAARLGADKCQICADAGLLGAFPLDNALDLSGLDKAAKAARIARANEDMMRTCDAVVANLTPFRGTSMDSGTAFEVGFMRALGRPVFGYSNVAADYAFRCRTFRAGRQLPFDLDEPSLEIEDFELPENLMIAVAVQESGYPVVVPNTENADVAPRLDDLSVFKSCVELAARQLLGG